MGKRLAEYILPVAAAALIVALGVALLLFHFAAPTGGPKGSPRSPGAQAGVHRTPSASPGGPALPPSPVVPSPLGPSAPSTASGLTPTRLVVPAAQIDAPVETVGVNAQGDIGVPSQASDAAWYTGSVAPGQPGNAILDGHLDWWTGPAVFWNLGHLHAGDQIKFVRADGSQVTFTDTGEQVLGAGARVPASMLAMTGPATVSLITCAGSWDAGRSEYLQRLIVYGTLS